MNRVELADSSANFRILRERIWSSDIYKWGRRMVAVATRPLRRLELCILYRYDLTRPIAPFDAGVDVEIVRATPADMEEAAKLRVPPEPKQRELFDWRLQHGCECFLARAGSKLVAYNWIRLRPGPEEGEMIALGEHEMYSFDLYVDENWRGNRIYTALGTRTRMFCKERGYTTAFARVSVGNRKSQKAIRRGGWHSAGLALRVRRSHGGWPILKLWGSAHPLARLSRDKDEGYPYPAH
jgi:GNAT superfamily N-acetyltransferase